MNWLWGPLIVGKDKLTVIRRNTLSINGKYSLPSDNKIIYFQRTMNWNYSNQYVTPSWSPYHQPNQFEHQLDPTFTGSLLLAIFIDIQILTRLFKVLNNSQLAEPDPRLLADFNHTLDRQLAVAYGAAGIGNNSESSPTSSSHQTGHHSAHHQPVMPPHHHDPALLIDSASSSLRSSVANHPSQDAKEELEHHHDPKMKIYPWMRRMHASQTKRGSDFYIFIAWSKLDKNYTDIAEHADVSVPRQGPSESKRIRTAYTRHQTLELGEWERENYQLIKHISRERVSLQQIPDAKATHRNRNQLITERATGENLVSK